MAVTVAETTVADPAVRRLLEAHARHCTEASPPESCHFMPADALDDPSITLWAARTEDGQLIGVGALKALPDAAGEVKSMHTAALRRGLGAGSAILGLDAVEDLLAVHRQVPWRLDADLHLAAAHTEDLHDDVLADHDHLADLPRQNKH